MRYRLTNLTTAMFVAVLAMNAGIVGCTKNPPSNDKDVKAQNVSKVDRIVKMDGATKVDNVPKTDNGADNKDDAATEPAAMIGIMRGGHSSHGLSCASFSSDLVLLATRLS